MMPAAKSTRQSKAKASSAKTASATKKTKKATPSRSSKKAKVASAKTSTNTRKAKASPVKSSANNNKKNTPPPSTKPKPLAKSAKKSKAKGSSVKTASATKKTKKETPSRSAKKAKPAPNKKKPVELRCTCGKCIGGFFSPYFRDLLTHGKDIMLDGFDNAVRTFRKYNSLDRLDVFLGGTPGEYVKLPSEVYKSFVCGIREISVAFIDLLDAGRLPTVSTLERGLRNGGISTARDGIYVDHFLQHGGSVAQVVRGMISHIQEQEEINEDMEEDFAEEGEEEEEEPWWPRPAEYDDCPFLENYDVLERLFDTGEIPSHERPNNGAIFDSDEEYEEIFSDSDDEEDEDFSSDYDEEEDEY